MNMHDQEMLALHMHACGAIKVAPRGASFILASGEKSQYYIDCRKASMSARGSKLIAQCITEIMFDRLDYLPEMYRVYIGGEGVGGSALVGGVLNYHGSLNIPTRGFVIRDTKKDHGTQQDIEGHLPPEDEPGHIFLLEDVITSGNSVLKAAKKVEEKGYTISGIIALVARGKEGLDMLGENKYWVDNVYRDDLLMDISNWS